MKTHRICLFIFISVCFLFGDVHAELIDRGGGLIYDTEQNITWLQDVNYWQTSGYVPMNGWDYTEVAAWVDQLEYTAPNTGITYNDWRLPRGAGHDQYYQIGNEIGHLYYISLNNTTGYDGTKKWGPFLNADRLESWKFWTSTASNKGLPHRFYFWFYNGYQYQGDSAQPLDIYPWPVRDGDVLSTPIDSDGDGVADANDKCPRDPNKSEPGKCGCGEPDGINYTCKALIDRGGGLIYDAEQNITWLQDALYWMTSGYVPINDWDYAEVEAWVEQLEYTDPTTGIIYDDWRLPKGTGVEGFNETNSEIGHLYYIALGNTAGIAAKNWGPFLHLDFSPGQYWTCTASNNGLPHRNYFWYYNGYQYLHDSSQNPSAPPTIYPWPIRDGDVFPLVPPQPADYTNYIPDAPHNRSYGMGCQACHSYSLWWEYGPLTRSDPAFAARNNGVCVQCHGSGGSAVQAQHHASTVLGVTYGAWSAQCIDCHDAHFQSQLEWVGTVPESELYLVRGTIGALGSFTTSSGNTSFAYSAEGTAVNWGDPNAWGNKNGSGQGLIFVRSRTETKQTFVVLTANVTTITVKGLLDPASAGEAFGLIYGQYINTQVTTGAGEMAEVKFFDPLGSKGFTNNETPQPGGICQVCHTRTLYWRADGSSSPHQGGVNCGGCHVMATGFKRP